MTKVIIEDNTPQGKQLFEYIKTLPYATVIEENKKSFREAAEEFFDELNANIKKHFDNA